MKRALKHLSLIAVLLLLAAGCGGKTIVKEEISEKVASDQNGDVTVSEVSGEGATEGAATDTGGTGMTGSENAVESEPLAEEELSSEEAAAGDTGPEGAATSEEQAQGSSTFASIMPSGELTDKAEQEGRLYTVHFDFDKYTIRPEDRDLLIKNAEWLRKNPQVKVWIEGHADERGSAEYNIALGEKRAKSVKKFLIDLGISPDRLSTITYGEERPVDPRHNEEAWAKNRRAEFVITKTN